MSYRVLSHLSPALTFMTSLALSKKEWNSDPWPMRNRPLRLDKCRSSPDAFNNRYSLRFTKAWACTTHTHTKRLSVKVHGIEESPESFGRSVSIGVGAEDY